MACSRAPPSGVLPLANWLSGGRQPSLERVSCTLEPYTRGEPVMHTLYTAWRAHRGLYTILLLPIFNGYGTHKGGRGGGGLNCPIVVH